MKIENWKQLNEKSAYNGYRKIVRRTYEMPDGTTSDFDILKGHGSVCIFALTENNTVIMAKQFRPGPGKVMYELPGGIIDKGENPETAAARELLEETGYVAEDIKLVVTYHPDAYYMGQRNVCIGKNAKKISEQKLDHNEFIEATEVSLNEFKKILESGELTDYAGGMAGLYYSGLL